MKSLIIECSSAIGSLAITEGTTVLDKRLFENPRGRGGALFSALETTVPDHPDLDAVLVGTGPGSYNSLRSSIAAAWGIARARGVPLRGICSLLGYEPADYDIIGDARAGQWFFASVRSGSLAAPVELMPPSAATARLSSSIPVFSTSPLLESATTAHPDPAILSLRSSQAGPADPVYLKPPHITTPTR